MSFTSVSQRDDFSTVPTRYIPTPIQGVPFAQDQGVSTTHVAQRSESFERALALNDVKIHEFLNATEFGNNLHTNAVINTKASLNSRLGKKHQGVLFFATSFCMLIMMGRGGKGDGGDDCRETAQDGDDGGGAALSPLAVYSTTHVMCTAP